MTAAQAVVEGAWDRAVPPSHRLFPPSGWDLPDLAEHLSAYGPLPSRRNPAGLVEAVRTAGLTGRGGAAFPVHRKMAAVAAARGRPVVVANASESEPASAKDKTLVWTSVHLVLDGLQLAAEAVGADQALFYLHRHEVLSGRVADALAERAARGLDRVPVRVVEAPPRFLAGEESALVSVAAGGGALPRFKEPPVFRRGVGGAPTLVQNAETLAHLALVARFGAAWFRTAGTPQEPGTMLITRHQDGSGTDVVEVPIGTPLDRVLSLDRPQAVQAVLIGGYHGTWLPADLAATLPLANAALRPWGASLGAGVVAALPSDRCGLVEAARVVRYLAVESAGQCGPCLSGLPRMAVATAELASPGPAGTARADLQRWANLVERRGACRHPDGTARFVRSAVQVFAAEVALHERGRCSASDKRPFLPVPAGAPTDETDWR